MSFFDWQQQHRSLRLLFFLLIVGFWEPSGWILVNADVNLSIDYIVNWLSALLENQRDIVVYTKVNLVCLPGESMSSWEKLMNNNPNDVPDIIANGKKISRYGTHVGKSNEKRERRFVILKLIHSGLASVFPIRRPSTFRKIARRMRTWLHGRSSFWTTRAKASVKYLWSHPSSSTRAAPLTSPSFLRLSET